MLFMLLLLVLLSVAIVTSSSAQAHDAIQRGTRDTVASTARAGAHGRWRDTAAGVPFLDAGRVAHAAWLTRFVGGGVWSFGDTMSERNISRE